MSQAHPTKLRIAVWYNLPSGGGKRALYEHMVGLRELGHSVEAWRPWVHQADYLPLGEFMLEHEMVEEMPDSERGLRGKVGRRWKRWTNYEAYRFNLLRDSMTRHSLLVAAEIRRGGFDVLFANTCFNFAAPYIGRYVSIPKLLYLQEPKRHLYESSPRLPWIALPQEMRSSKGLQNLRERRKYDRIARVASLQAAEELDNAAAFDRILCNSVFSRESILRAYGLDATVCYLGTDASVFENKGLPREGFVISVGVFHPAKGVEFVVRSLATIERDRPRLIWVANVVYDDYLDQMNALAKNLGVELEVRRSIPDAELRDLYNRAATAVYAPRLEPFGYLPLEANACGCPVVAVAEGGVKETVIDGENGILVPHRPEAMGRAIATLIADPALAKRLGDRGAQLTKTRWTRRAAALELEKNLFEVVDRGAGR